MTATPSGSGAAVPEIERVFLLRGMPPLPPHAELWEIEQGYLPPPGSGADLEGRLRRQVEGGATRHLLTRKRGLGIVRSEEEREISAEEFAKWWPRTEGRRLRKTRHRVAAEGVIWEIDRFEGLELVLAEVELPDPRTPIEIPAWLAPLIVREVTEDPRYRNFELARRGGLLPEERA
jgi:adenylate cyclase